jgi:hypothetical protein
MAIKVSYLHIIVDESENDEAFIPLAFKYFCQRFFSFPMKAIIG